jgi:signal transduction histidine kinase
MFPFEIREMQKSNKLLWSLIFFYTILSVILVWFFIFYTQSQRLHLAVFLVLGLFILSMYWYKRIILANKFLITLMYLFSFYFANRHGVQGPLLLVLVFLPLALASILISVKLGLWLLLGQLVYLIALVYWQRSFATLQINYQYNDLLELGLTFCLLLAILFLLIYYLDQLKKLKLNAEIYYRERIIFAQKFDYLVLQKERELSISKKLRQKELEYLASVGQELATRVHDWRHEFGNFIFQFERLAPQLANRNEQDYQKADQILRKLNLELRSFCISQLKDNKYSHLETEIQNCIEKQHPVLDRNRIQIITKIEPALIAIPSNIIARFIYNLIINSTESLQEKYHNDGGRILIQGKINKHNYLLSVWDNGMGIDEFLLKHLPQAWLTSKDASHLGLGLASIKDYLDNLPEGGLHLESRKNKWSKISLKIPLWPN